MSRNGHPVFSPSCGGAIVVGTFDMRIGQRFSAHSHPEHQLAWSESGILAVTIDAQTWILPSTRALWIPAGLVHTTDASSPATMTSAYFRKRRCSIRWKEPTVVSMSPLCRELVRLLARRDVARGPRSHAQRLLLATLEPLSTSAIATPILRDPRARRVADALEKNPADARSLGAFGKAAGASARTLARLFQEEAGMTFGEWRARARMRAALVQLASGAPVNVVAGEVGYASPSAFIAAFRRQTGMSPRAYFPDRRSASGR